MGKIFYLMGKSSCGKDSIYKKLIEDGELNLKKITGYTTRPIREGETDGVEYFFVTKEDMKKLNLIEMRSYNTVAGEWCYATADDGNINESDNYLIIGTLESYECFLKYYGKDRIVPLYIEVDDYTRLIRSLNREKQQATPRYDEICRRYLADEADFDKENIEKLGIKKKFENYDFLECVNNIKNYIKQVKLI